MSSNTPIYSKSPSPELIQLQSKQLDLESGLLGKIFGSSKSAPSNIASLCLLLILISGIALTFGISGKMEASEYWKYLSPTMSLIFGYLFGKNSWKQDSKFLATLNPGSAKTTSLRNLYHNDTKSPITQFITQSRFSGLKYWFILIFGEPGFLLNPHVPGSSSGHKLKY